MLAAVGMLCLTSCNEKPANDAAQNANPTENAATQDSTAEAATADEPTAEAATTATATATAANQAPEPTGDVEKDAMACATYLAKVVEQTDFSKKEDQKRIETLMHGIEAKFEKYYSAKGAQAKSAFDEACVNAKKKIGLEALMSRKVIESLKAAGVDVGGQGNR